MDFAIAFQQAKDGNFSTCATPITFAPTTILAVIQFNFTTHPFGGLSIKKSNHTLQAMKIGRSSFLFTLAKAAAERPVEPATKHMILATADFFAEAYPYDTNNYFTLFIQAL